MALLSGQRCQTIHSITVGSVNVYHEKVVIVIPKLIKQSRRKRHLPPLELMAFENPKLCIVHTINEYLHRTQSMRAVNKKGEIDENSNLFLSYLKPHKPVSRDTVARWIRDVLTKSGIDTRLFTPHSTRSASTSAAVRKGTPMNIILKTAGWSRQSTFAAFYNKVPVQNMGDTLLRAYRKK